MDRVGSLLHNIMTIRNINCIEMSCKMLFDGTITLDNGPSPYSRRCESECDLL